VPQSGGGSPGSPLTQGGLNLYRSRQLQRRRRTRQAFALVVLLPTLIAGVYYCFIASDRYVSETQFVVNADSPEASDPTMGMIGSGTVSAPGTIMLYNYIQSMEMMNKLEAAVGFRARFATDKADFFSRLKANASQEERYAYFLKRVKVIGEPSNPILIVRVEGFTPKDAQDILNAIVTISSDRLNTLLSKRQIDTIAFAQATVDGAKNQLLDVQGRMTTYRTEHSEIDPVKAAGGVAAMVASLAQAIADQRADLAGMLSDMRPNNPQVQAAVAKIKGLEIQLDKARKDLAGQGGKTYADLVSQFETLQAEEKLTEDEYSKALEFLTLARADATRQHAYVLDFVSPNMPEKSTEPERGRAVLTAFIVAVLLFGIGQLVIMAIREQSGV
jgi:capsular polysaccharide transport system permease protein